MIRPGQNTVAPSSHLSFSTKGAKAGFTIIELIVVLAIFAITAATTLPFLGRFQQRETLTTITEDIARTLRTAQHKAIAGEHDSNWGVHFEDSAYILYAGNSFTSRLRQFDRRHGTPRTLIVEGNDDITFTKSIGTPSTSTGDLVIRSPEGDPTVITINAEGGIFLQKQQ